MQTEVTWKPRVLQPQPAPADFPRLIWEILSARGYDNADEMRSLLSPTLKSLRDPFLLTDMDKAIERLVVAFERGEKICIYCDYDLDGTSACAMLLDAFARLGFTNVAHYQPKRLTEGYGLHKEALQKLFDSGVRLVLTADLGITAIDEVEFANQLGVDVIVTDHHLPKDRLPEAVAVVNPNRGNCASELGHLCGTGVAFYLILALRRTLLERGLTHDAFDPKLLLDCFVIGTLTDMVPLKEENRVLVKHGLAQLGQTQRPGLRALLQALKLWGFPLTSQDVAIRFAPKLNALSRMERGVQPLDIYLTKDEAEAQRLVTEVLANNQLRQASQRDAENEALAQMKAQAPRGCCFVWSKNFHRGVVGLVATRLSQEFGLPAFVGSVDERGQVTGSARLPNGAQLSLLDALEANSELLVQFGGHAMACGFELEEKNAAELALRLGDWFGKLFTEARVTEWLYDAEATLDEFSPAFMQWYEHLAPFGAHFEAPVFLVSGVKVAQAQELKGGHMRLTLSSGSSANSRTAIWFSPPKGHAALEGLQRPGARVDLLVEPQWNYYAGRRSLQLLVEDVRVSRI